MSNKVEQKLDHEDMLKCAVAAAENVEPLDLDRQVKLMRQPMRSRPNWSPPELFVEPVTFARQSLKHAVEKGREVEQDDISRWARKARDTYKHLAYSASTAVKALEKASNDSKDWEEGLLPLDHEIRVGGSKLCFDDRDIPDPFYRDVGNAIRVLKRIADNSGSIASGLSTSITHSGDLFRLGFVHEMAKMYFILTGLRPTRTRKDEGTQFLRFVDAAQQAIYTGDLPSCAGILREPIRRFDLDYTLTGLEEERKQHWKTPPSDMDPPRRKLEWRG